MSSTSITFFNEQGCRTCLLPATENADHEVVLYEKWFWLEEDVRVLLECVRGQWFLKRNNHCRIFQHLRGHLTPVSGDYELRDGALLQLVTVDDEKINALVQCRDSLFMSALHIPLASLHRVRIGTGDKNELRIPSGIAIEDAGILLTRDWHGFSAVPRQGTFYLNGEAIRSESFLEYGDTIEIPGFCFMYLGDDLAVLTGASELVVKAGLKTRHAAAGDRIRTGSAQAPAAMQIDKEKSAPLFHRSPRILPRIYDGTIKIEGAPELEEPDGRTVLQALVQSIAMVIPMMLASFLMIYASSRSGYGGSIMMYSGLVMAVSSGGVAAILAVTNTNREKRRFQEKQNRRFEAYSNYLINKTDEIREKYQSNTESMREMYPPAASLLAEGVGRGLWNRNRRQEDFLKIRIGTGDIPFQVRIDVPEEKFHILEDELRDKPRYIHDNFETLYKVPILLDLADHPLIGIAGGEGCKGAMELMHVICAQLCATHSYTDVRMIFFYEEDKSLNLGQWDFAKWLPHSFSANRSMRMTAVTGTQIGDVSYELSTIFRNREDEISGMDEDYRDRVPHYVLFLSNPRLIQGELIAHYIYEVPKEVGLTTVILSDTIENLPNECRYVLQNDGFFSGIVETQEVSREYSEVEFDTVETQALNRFAASIAGVRVQETGDSGEIPDAVTFFEMYGVHRLGDFHAEELWRKNRVYENIRGLLGIKSGETRMYMDVHEKYHGPHGLVAGTTGSGKSETLQTYLLSLAIEYSPDDIGFFIIDYKGGGMANLFDGLPHLLGSISNLSGAQIRRAMVAIKSENRRRQRMFNDAGVNNINKYTVLYKNGEVEEPIPHLFIIIDEFAELKREEPDFMKELISVAQVGRSLGVHLILSTQRPAGTVDENIASNAKFRLCLRVQTKEDSMDMLGKPDAAFITQAGRCYLQVGNDEVYEQFQSGFSGAIYNPDEVDSENLTRMLTMTGVDDIIASASTGGRHDKSSSDKKKEEKTQLDVVKEYLWKIAKDEGYREIHRLWLPPLKTSISLDEIPEYLRDSFHDGSWNEVPGDKWALNAVIGLVDDPSNQAQVPLRISFDTGGHHAVIGQVVTGKSTLLQTIVYSLVNRYTPDYFNFYGLDFSSRMLAVFEGLPHTGGIMYEGDDEKIGRFFNMIEKILDERRKTFRGGNYSQYYRANGLKYPAILIAIDNFSAFSEKTGERYLPALIRLSKEGESNGIFLLVSGGGFSLSEIPNRLGSNFKTCLCLEMKDKFAYTDYLHTMRFDVLPEAGVRGRGLCVIDGKVLEYQTALSLAASDDYERMQKMEARCAVLAGAWEGPAARKVPEIPENPDWAGFEALKETQEAFAKPALLPVGYREDNAEVYSLDLSTLFVYLITGTAKSGKTSFLTLTVLSALHKPDARIILVGPDMLSGLPETDAVTLVSDAEQLYQVCGTSLADEFVKRRKTRQALVEEDLLPEEIYASMAERFGPIFIMIEDLPWLINILKGDGHGISGFLENLARKGEGHLVYLFACLSMEDKAKIAGYSLADALTGSGDGIHFGGNLSQNTYMNFSYVAFMDQNRPEKPGIGQIPNAAGGEDAKRVVVPSVRKSRRRGESRQVS